MRTPGPGRPGENSARTPEEPSGFRGRIVVGEGRQTETKGPQFGVREVMCRRPQMHRGGCGKRLPSCRFHGNGRQGCHFHNDVPDRVATSDAGLRQQRCVMQPQAGRPGRARREKDEASVTKVREATFAGQRGGQQVAQATIQRIQCARPCGERLEVDALRDGHGPAAGWSGRWTLGLHGGTPSAKTA